MIETYFEHAPTLAFLRSGKTGPHIDGFATFLLAGQYTHRTARSQLLGVAHVGQWMEANKIEIAALDESVLDSFFAHIPICDCVPRHSLAQRQYYSAGGRNFLSWARPIGFVTSRQPSDPIPPLIAEFEAWMILHRNVAMNSLRDVYRFPLRRLLTSLGEDPGQWNARNIRRFVLEEASRVSGGTAGGAVSTIRQMLRFLAVTGRCTPELVHAPPKIARWGRDTLPAYISPENVDRIIAVCDPATAAGCQDRAMLLLMARIGLRAGDVAALRFGDLDWSAATVSVFGKSRRPARLPLPQDVGDSILTWLNKYRPAHDDDHVFLRLRPPIRPHPDGQPVSARAALAARRAGVVLVRAGSHVLRHSAATSLLNEGMSLPAIGALLRHASLETTAIYAKVDERLLQSVARAWPSEVAS